MNLGLTDMTSLVSQLVPGISSLQREPHPSHLYVDAGVLARQMLHPVSHLPGPELTDFKGRFVDETSFNFKNEKGHVPIW